jgi:hypothetical protein
MGLLWRGSRDDWRTESHLSCNCCMKTPTRILYAKGNTVPGLRPVKWESHNDFLSWKGNHTLGSFA